MSEDFKYVLLMSRENHPLAVLNKNMQSCCFSFQFEEFDLVISLPLVLLISFTWLIDWFYSGVNDILPEGSRPVYWHRNDGRFSGLSWWIFSQSARLSYFWQLMFVFHAAVYIAKSCKHSHLLKRSRRKQLVKKNFWNTTPYKTLIHPWTFSDLVAALPNFHVF